MLELLQQVLGFGFLGLVAVSYMYIVSQKPKFDDLYKDVLNRKKYESDSV